MDFLASLKVQANNAGVSTGKAWINTTGSSISSYSPVDGKLIGTVQAADWQSYEAVVAKAEEAFLAWRQWPAPKRGKSFARLVKPSVNIKNPG
ncbi:aldehyde dehydrogenase family protein [Paraflavitalea speifideaquila]|uniref:aldehyde dehydrogenase family protein n=1 Tax=Paraflavitalea speifideaquila TaxID=3076558 RepID=UPI0028EC04E0|nr:aldehyde dehydrogenase family protein [Paraflavitalea speifideiaquila]